VQVFVGALEGIDGRVGSPASVDTELLGADLVLEAGTTLVPVDPRFELAVAPLDGTVRVGDEVVAPGWLALVPPGVEELPISTRTAGARVLLIGGVPLGDPIAMWWNFVARDREELTAAWHDWNTRTDRFGTVASPLERLEAPAPPWVRTA
jgi:redox-sensitive bicupin YhaK (pirin superfamily)